MMNKDSKIAKKRISILGCGWLGMPLAKRLLAGDITSKINGSTTSKDKLDTLQEAHIQSYLLTLTPGFEAEKEYLQSFFDADTLVISLPPRMSQNEPGHYLRQIEAVIAEIKSSPIREIIFFSSTSVYPDLNKVITENEVEEPHFSPQPEMVKAENMIASLRPDLDVCILRLAGLIGHNRIPGNYVKGKRDLSTGMLPVNYIHPDDAVNMITTILQKGLYNETFNIVAPLHPTRREVYDSNCTQFNWEAPTYSTPNPTPPYKIISGEKFSSYYSYQFQYPDPLLFKFQYNR